MRFQRLHSHVLRKYIACNIGLVVIPVIVLAALYFLYARNQIILQFEDAQTYALEQAMQSADANLADFGTVAAQVSTDAALTPYNLTSSNASTMEAIGRLRAYHARTSFLNEMFLYIKGGDTIYTSEGVISVQNYTAFRYTFEGDWTAADFYGALQNPSAFSISSSRRTICNRSGSYILLLRPWPATATQAFGCFGGLVKTSYFEQLLEGIGGSVDSASYITDNSGTLLFSAEKNAALTQAEIRALLESHGEGGLRQVRLGAEEASVIILESAENGWYYMTLLPHRQFTSRLFGMLAPYLLILSLLLLFSIAMGIWISYSNYQPIYELRRLLGNTERRKEAPPQGELRELSKSVQSMVDKNRALSEQVDRSRRMNTQKLLAYIVKNDGVLEDGDFREQLAREEIYLDGPYYCMITVDIPQKATPEELDSFCRTIRLVSENTAYALDMIYRDMTAVLCNLKSPVRGAHAMVELIFETVDCLFHAAPRAGVGHAYREPGMLSHSLTEAIVALDEGSLTGKQGAVYYDDLRARQSTEPYWVLPPAFLRLLQGLRQGSNPVIEDAQRELRQRLNAAREDVMGFRFMADSMIQQLLPLLQEAGAPISDQEIDRLIHFTDRNDFFILLQALCNEITAAFKRKKRGDRDTLFEQVEGYVREHACEQSMSLNLLASEFDMSPPGMSKFFREKADRNFIDYLTDLRMERARRLLSETDLRIRDIMEQVGYTDISSFTRKFTLVVGMSPGKYRSKGREKPD